MNTELSDLIILIDSREKESNRINSMRTFFEERGACVDVEAITIKSDSQITSMDYSLEGNFRGKEVKLGISAKSMVDLSATIGNLSNELARGYLRFDEIGFILITGCYETVLSTDELHAYIRNKGAEYKNKDDRADILNTTSMFNALASWERAGIHCRQVLYEHDFPKAVISILTFITKESHEGVGFNTKGVTDPIERSKFNFVNANIHLGVDGMGVKTALKLREYLIAWNYPPNMHFATSLSEEDLQEAIGKKTGSALYQAYRCRDGWTEFKGHSEASTGLPLNEQAQSKVNIPETVKSLLNQSYNLQSSSTEQQREATSAVSVKAEKQSDNKTKLGTHDNLQPHSVDRSITVGFEPEQKKEGGHESTSSSVATQAEAISSGKLPTNEGSNPSGATLQSQRGFQSLSSCDTAGPILVPTPPLQSPAVTSSNLKEIKSRETIKSLEDAIVDRVYEKPVESTVIMREFATRGHTIPEVHQMLLNSKKLHKYKDGGVVMIAYTGVTAEKEMDVGV